jgi:hypothetical protein
MMTLFTIVKTKSAVALPLLQAEPPARNLEEGLAALVLVALIGVCLMAFMVVLAALLPRLSERTKTALVRSPWRAFFIGLANYIFLGGISLVLLNIEPIALLGVLILTALAVITVLGLPGLADLLGERIAGLRGRNFSPWQRLLWGALGLELAGLLPFIGWFVLTPALLLMAFGAAVLSWFNRKQSAPPADIPIRSIMEGTSN